MITRLVFLSSKTLVVLTCVSLKHDNAAFIEHDQFFVLPKQCFSFLDFLAFLSHRLIGRQFMQTYCTSCTNRLSAGAQIRRQQKLNTTFLHDLGVLYDFAWLKGMR